MIGSFLLQKTMQNPKHVIITFNVRSQSDFSPGTQHAAPLAGPVVGPLVRPGAQRPASLAGPEARGAARCVPGRISGPARDAARCAPGRTGGPARNATCCTPGQAGGPTRDAARCALGRTSGPARDTAPRHWPYRRSLTPGCRHAQSHVGMIQHCQVLSTILAARDGRKKRKLGPSVTL